jgi:hypothetical protein
MKLLIPLKYVFSGKPLIAPDPEVGKFQNWLEMKVYYPIIYSINKKNTHKGFFAHFHNMKIRLIFSSCRSQKTDDDGRKFPRKKTHRARLSCKNISKIGQSY